MCHQRRGEGEGRLFTLISGHGYLHMNIVSTLCLQFFGKERTAVR
jgi:hypothetical protein